jgi:hypothetical protein
MMARPKVIGSRKRDSVPVVAAGYLAERLAALVLL